MVTILKNGIEKIMKLFYLNRDRDFHFREISRKTKLNINSVSRFLTELQKKEIVSFRKEGNQKKVYLNDNYASYLIFSIFDFERLKSLPDVRKRAINIFLKSLKVKPLIVVLFGSTAKGTFDKNSDIDLLLIVNDKINVSKSKEEVNSQTGLVINVFQIKFEDFLNEIKLKKEQLIQSVINTGFPIQNNITYYEVLKNG